MTAVAQATDIPPTGPKTTWADLTFSVSNLPAELPYLLNLVETSIGKRNPVRADTSLRIKNQLITQILDIWGHGAVAYFKAVSAIAERGLLAAEEDLPKAHQLLIAAQRRASDKFGTVCGSLKNPEHGFQLLADFIRSPASFMNGLHTLNDLERAQFVLKRYPAGLDPSQCQSYEVVLEESDTANEGPSVLSGTLRH